MAVRQRPVEGMVMLPKRSFWQGKRVLLTGHTGFKGAWFALWLQRLGAQVVGLALAPATQPNLYSAAAVERGMRSHLADIRNAQAVAQVVHAEQPEIVLHLAAQALVRASYADPLASFATNTLGTAHVLDALRGVPSVRVALVVTTDKVYHNREHAYPYREDDVLGGHDPYSASKAAAELVAASYRDAFLRAQGVAVATARAGNVIGGGDWSTDRLLPDAIRAWQSGQPLMVRSPHATRPWQHVLEPLAGYLQLVQRLWDDANLAGAYNFGPPTQEAATVRHVLDLARSAYGAGEIAYPEASANDTTQQQPHEANYLALETAKARHLVGVQPRWSLAQAVQRSVAWYRAQHNAVDARTLCETDIASFEASSIHP